MVPPRGTRPTTDRVRESLFNVLAARLDFAGLAVLDLFAGSGALGLEALSRGAQKALFVESAARAVGVIEANIKALGVSGATVRRGTVNAVLSAGAVGQFDLVFADPPYDVSSAEVGAVLEALAGGWVADGGLAVIERPSSAQALEWPAGWEPLKARRYGDTTVEFAERVIA
ncbi:16S rRNA (guanine(966)-N(2))-methyltransferase RsmD [Mycolicibacterium confluentis]|uniref:16S rRNA (Guanine(966)-N(2))-methyltransferase RsmD n=1 Tax=Mycolicibacterium confluentis TaxID=28047 RepID=A0A7I7XYE9_9MYCO|nr:16S rRNA (guanine(966)-N(2))-methyltransferase RsmD [Mycolicibacterium confluentis]